MCCYRLGIRLGEKFSEESQATKGSEWVFAGKTVIVLDKDITFEEDVIYFSNDNRLVEEKLLVSAGVEENLYPAVASLHYGVSDITDFYSGEKYEVSAGSVSATCDANGVILLEGSGIVKASVGLKSKNKSATYSADTIDITLKANKAKDTYYQINEKVK